MTDRGRLIYQHWRRDTLREVYFGHDGRVTKRFWVRPGTRHYPRPWVREDAALRRLEGLGFPKSYGVQEREFERGLEVVFVRDFVAGTELDHVAAAEAVEIGHLLAAVHEAGVVVDDAAMDNFIRTDDGRIVCIDFGCARVFKRRGAFLFFAVGEELAKLKRRTFYDDEGLWDIFCKAYFEKIGLGFWGKLWLWGGYGVARGTRWLRKELLGREKRRFGYYRERYGLAKPPREKRYEGGRLFVRPGLDCREALETYIFKQRFGELPEEKQVLGCEPGEWIYSFYLPVAEREVVLKVYGGRKWFGRNRAKRGFFGALAVGKVGVHTVEPLAYWSSRGAEDGHLDYFMYTKCAAISTVQDLKQGVDVHPTAEGGRMLDAMVDRLADVMRRMHECGLRQVDVGLGGFLVEEGDVTAPESDPARRYNVVLLDTERVRFNRLRPQVLKLVFDLREFWQLDLDDRSGRDFLKRYLGSRYSEGWWKVYCFWKRYGKHPGLILLGLRKIRK